MNPDPGSKPRALFDKLWDGHIVHIESDAPSILYIDLHLIHEVTSPQAFTGLTARDLKVRRPQQTVATMDHSTPTTGLTVVDPIARAQLETLEKNCREHGIEIHRVGTDRHGIVHVIGPELGLTRPGMTIVCGDSHTATHGAFGALAFGIGTSEVEHVLATQCLLQRRPRTCEVRIEGNLGRGITAKDVVLAIIGEIGTAGGTGYAIEFGGEVLRGLSIEGRMTVCNMAIEAGARAGMVAVDEATLEYVKGRPFAPSGDLWDRAAAAWRDLHSDADAVFDRVVKLRGEDIKPQVTWGTSPEMVLPVDGVIPDPAQMDNATQREATERSLEYMGLTAGMRITDIQLDTVFIGSCTNSRIEDLRAAAAVLKGKQVAASLRRALVVPGSGEIKKQAEAEGLDQIFKDAGAEWREPGCSMCIAMNGDNLEPGQYAVSTSNRNFEGRQGKGGRTFLASPLTAAAAAIAGEVTDPRSLLLS